MFYCDFSYDCSGDSSGDKRRRSNRNNRNCHRRTCLSILYGESLNWKRLIY